MEKTFETEVLSRLAVIESKLDGYKDLKKIVYDCNNRATQNEEEIKDLKDKLKWLSRTTGGAIITGIIGLVFVFIKIGMGVN